MTRGASDLAGDGMGRETRAGPRLRGLVVLTLLAVVYGITAYRRHYFEYPFHFNADADALFMAQSLWAANGHPITYAGHPGTTAFSILAPTLKALSGTGIYLKSIDLDALRSAGHLNRLLTQVVLVGRCVFGLVAVLTGFFTYLLLRRLRCPTLIAAALGFYLALSDVMVVHGLRGRPENLAALFILVGCYLWIRLVEARATPSLRAYLAGTVVLGACFILSILSKILGAILVAAVLVVISVRVFVDLRLWDRLPFDRPRMLVALGLVGAILFPWWALGRPDPSGVTFDTYTMKVFRNAAPTFMWQALGLHMVGWGVLGAAVRLRPRAPVASRVLSTLAASYWGIVIGISVGVYLGALPLGLDPDVLIANIHLEVYSAFAHLTGASTFYGRYVERGLGEYLTVVSRAHRENTHDAQVLAIGLWQPVNHGLLTVGTIAAGWSTIVLAAGGLRRRFERRHALVAFLVGLAWLMDYVIMQRAAWYYREYAVYTLLLLCVAVGCFFAIQWDRLGDAIAGRMTPGSGSRADRLRDLAAVLFVLFLGAPLLQVVTNRTHYNLSHGFPEELRFHHGLHKQFFADYSPDLHRYLNERGSGYGKIKRMSRARRNAIHERRVRKERKKRAEERARRRAERAAGQAR